MGNKIIINKKQESANKKIIKRCLKIQFKIIIVIYNLYVSIFKFYYYRFNLCFKKIIYIYHFVQLNLKIYNLCICLEFEVYLGNIFKMY